MKWKMGFTGEDFIFFMHQNRRVYKIIRTGIKRGGWLV